VVEAMHPAALLPDTHAHFLGENPQHVYDVAFDSSELWGPDAESFKLHIDLYENYLEEV
jgi:nitrile hydratase